MTETNPIGNPNLDVIKDQINEVIEAWMQDHPAANNWYEKITINWNEVVNFLTRAADYFIKTIDKLEASGPNKKATVMEALNQIYDFIIPPLMPIWVKPFGSSIKAFIFNVLISNTIDYFVSKYRAGEWNASVNVKFM